MNTKKDLLCIDKCKMYPKFFTDMNSTGQHLEHECQSIETIQNRMLEPNNLKIINDFLTECSLNSILAQFELLKQEILKNFALNVTQIFEVIIKSLGDNWIENQRLEGILRAIIPDYKQDVLSQIKGNFSFLQSENIKVLQGRTIDQSRRNMKARSDIDSFAKLVERLFRQYNILKLEQALLPFDQRKVQSDVQLSKILQKEEPIKLKQFKNSLIKFNPARLITWKDDFLLAYHKSMANSQQKQFSFEYQEPRQLLVKRQTLADTSQDDLSKMVCLCLDFMPNGLTIDLINNGLVKITPFIAIKEFEHLILLDINLGGNGIKDIFPLSAIEFLVNLSDLTIDLQYNQVIDITPLSAIKSLIKITTLIMDLSKNEISDITPLSAIKNLVNLKNMSILIEFQSIKYESKNKLPERVPWIFNSYFQLKDYFKQVQ